MLQIFCHGLHQLLALFSPIFHLLRFRIFVILAEIINILIRGYLVL